MQLHWRPATRDDAPLLGEMNRRLIEDERHRNPMTVAELVGRMEGFLAGEYTAILFGDDGGTLGYALYHPQDDFIYLRQFFVERRRRREGIGRAAMRLLMDDIIPRDRRVVVSVLATNPDALEFWRAVGFADYCTTLEVHRESRACDPPAG